MTSRRRRKIEDFGEHIPGARKELAVQGLRAGMDEDPMFRGSIGKTWPKPPWEEIERQHTLENRTTGDLAFERALRDLLKTRDGKIAEQALCLAIAQNAAGAPPRSFRTLALAVLRGEMTHHEALDELGARRPWMRRECDLKTALYQAAGHMHDLSRYTVWEGTHRSGPRYGRRFFKVRNGCHTVAMGETIAEAGANLAAALAKNATETGGKPSTDRSAFVPGENRRAGVVIHGVLRKAGGRWRMIEEYPSPDAVRRALKDEREIERLEAKWKTWTTIPPERRAANERRTPDAAEGTSSPNEFMARFGFRGVQFGNWVGKDRRTTDLDEASQGFTDLARVLHWPESLLALNGRLALAFGARGKGGRNAPKAHYESGQRVIAISKPSGPGSLAHEWFHGLDNNCFEIAGVGHAGFGTEVRMVGWRLHRRKEMDPFVKELSDLGEILAHSPMRDRAAKLDMRRPKSKPYWSTRLELAARAFEAWVIDELRKLGIRNDYLANIRSPGEWEGRVELDQEYPYPYPDELQRVAPSMERIAALGLKRLAADRGQRRTGNGPRAHAAQR